MVVHIIGEQSEGSIATARIETTAGAIMVMAEVVLENRCLTLRDLHIHGVDIRTNDIGAKGLRRMVQEVMEDLDVDEIIIEGAVRTTGAGPGRTPRCLRFTRKVFPAK